MLKLIFSPYYDGDCYAGNPKNGKCELGTKYVGPLGLLDELELRAGMSRGETSPMRRAIAYCNAIREVLNSHPSSEPFYQDSFENDPLGVAQKLLLWRDALCMAGWNKDTKLPDKLTDDGRKRLEDLKEVETHFNSIGIGERWHQLLKADLDTKLPEDLKIQVEMKMELLPPVIREVLKKTKRAKESEAVANLGGKTLGDFSKKFTLYQFPEQNDAYQWAVTQTEYTPDVYINEDNFTFNQVLKSVGEPLVDASVNGGATELSQLLKLGISLFRNPVNYDNLINYLSIFRHPIDWETRRLLSAHLKQVGGFNDWVRPNKPIIKIKETAKNCKAFWGMWEYGNDGSDETDKKARVPVDKVDEFCEELLKWIKTATVKAKAEKTLSPLSGTQVCAQLSQLQERTELLRSILKGMHGDITNDELDKLVTSICQGGSVSADFARIGSYDMLNDLKGLAVKVKTVMWMDCVRKPRPRYEYAFLNPADIKELQNAELMIPDATLEMQASDFAEKLAVSRAERIIALMPQRKDGERTDENLIITELRVLDKKISIIKPGLPKGVTVSAASACTQKVEHKVAPTLFTNVDQPKPKTDEDKTATSTPSKFTPKPVGYQRDYESFSSLSELINQPFDYVLDYIYNMKNEDSGNLATVEGNVAHAVIEQMVTECKDPSGKVDTSQFLNICKNSKDLEARTDQAILGVGLQLLQPENEMECLIFKRIFTQKSVPVLVKIIEDNNLEVVGSEVEYTNVLQDTANPPQDAFNFNAKIDFLLKRKSEVNQGYEYLIFDFKWTGNPSKREKELEECKELQLALYQKIAEVNKLTPVVMRGYYLLKQAQLLTVNEGVLNPDANIVIVKQKGTYDIFAQAVASYRERIKNLKDGYIEEGEEMKGPEFEKTKFISVCLADFKTNNAVSSYFLDNKLEMAKKKDKLGQMNVAEKATSYGKNSVLKGKIK